MTRKVEITNNWMSTVDSPSYKLSLYLVAPEVFEDPVTLTTYANIKSNIRQNGRAVLIAETGVTTEYSIDNLTMMSFYGPSPGSGSTQTGILQFNLTEPLGFKLLNRILKYASAFGFGTIQSALYVLKVEFTGRDPETSRAIKYGGEFFYAIQIKQIQATVTEMGTRYNIIANNMPKTAANLAINKLPLKIPAVKSVNQFLKNLEKQCNEMEIELRKNPNFQSPVSKHKWKFVLDDSAKFNVSERINIPQYNDGSGHTTVMEKFDLGNKPIAGTANSGSAGGQNRNMSDSTSTDVNIGAESNIVSWIGNYLTKNVEAIATLNEKQRTDGISRSIIRVTPSVKFLPEIDEFTNTQAREVTITVGMSHTYSVPQVNPKKQKEKQDDRQQQKKWFAELPITKRYNYLYSGLNTEIINFDMTIEQMFFQAMDPADGQNYGTQKESRVPTNPEPPKTSNRANAGNTSGYATFLGQLDGSNSDVFERISYQYNLASPDSQQLNESKGKDSKSLDSIADKEFQNRSIDFLEISLNIKGDPFWMGTPGVKHTEAVVAADQFLNTDSLILFINYLPNQIEGNNFEFQGKGELDLAASGVYEVRQIETSMSNGQFTQTLKCFRNRNISTFLLQNEMEQRI